MNAKTGTAALITTLLAAPAWAGSPAATRVSVPPSTVTAPAPAAAVVGSDSDTLVFSAPPRETAAQAADIYAPIAEYLSAVTGKKVVYRQPGNWLTYQTEMQKGAYDIVFDGPHFNGWRAANLQHNVLVKLPGDHVFAVVVKKENDKVKEVKQLAGRAVCGMSPPNLGSIMLLSQFDNPARQPVILPTNGWDNIYAGVADGRCQAAVLPLNKLEKLDRDSKLRVVFKAKALPNQAFSAGPRVTPGDQIKISRALLSPEGRLYTSKLREAYAVSGEFAPAARTEYLGLATLLKDSWGY
jgi:ABC-type phosphate/phosphonate transport system substrate-binding protein